MGNVILIVFWGSYILLVLRLALWLAKHPLGVGACVLLLYMVGRVVVGLVVRFVAGVFLFLTGVSGMMVAFLYVVALCPNPIFNVGGGGGGYAIRYLSYVGLVFLFPRVILGISCLEGFSVEMGSASESLQWLSDPCIFGGLVELIPFLGVLLFLCMVRVVRLCGQQKQCLGGHRFSGGDVFILRHTKRAYA